MKKIKLILFLVFCLFIGLFVHSCADKPEAEVCTIVVIGSSTAEGTGASVPDSAWVNRFEASLSDKHLDVVNLAKGGYTTYHLLPTGTEIPDTITIEIDEQRNVSKALSYAPSAIIVNLPSNDASYRFSEKIQIENFQKIVDAANKNDVAVWVATTQPRNFEDSTQLQIQTATRDAILTTYGDHAIDFWSEIATSDSHILSKYDSGDGIHLNDAGQALLFRRVQGKAIDSIICNKKN